MINIVRVAGFYWKFGILKGKITLCVLNGTVIYYDPKIVATALIERNNQILIIKRAVQVGYGLWSLPGGYVDRGEIVENAAAREVLEETGLKVKTDKLLGLFSEQGNPVLVAAYTATETGGCLKAGPEALELGFYSPDNLPTLAFPRDQLIIETWLSSSGS
ncbi:MAG: NUDIX hydrolase [Chloroflexota bacterium]|nr:MAG: NUDIX hydrolase [Chloroflexota bacterium]